MKKNGLLSKILIPVLILVFLSGSLVTFANYRISSDSLTEMLFKEAEGITAHSNNFFTEFFISQEENVNILSQMPAIKNALAKPEVTQEALDGILKNSDAVLNVYVATTLGDFYVHPEVELPPEFKAKERPWYLETVAKPDEVIWQKPYIDTASGKLTITATKTVKDYAGKVIGVFGIDLDLDKFGEYLKDTKIGETGYTMVLDREGNFLYHPDASLNGKNVKDHEFAKQLFAKKDKSGHIVFKEGKVEQDVYYQTNEKGNFYVLGNIPLHEFDAKLNEVFAPMLLVLLVIVVLIGIRVWFVVRRNLKPLKGLHEGIHKVENGDFSVEVEIKTNDEIGLLTKGFNHMITQIRAMMKTIEGAANEVKAASTSMVVGTEENAKAITETSVTMERIANGANKQAELVEDNSKKMSDLSMQLEAMDKQSENIRKGSEIMRTASQTGAKNIGDLRNQSKKTTEITNEMVEAIRSLDVNSKNIGEIITTISGIADQTNVLAMNAAIEAARAGEMGKGFAVVADEVRKLAEKSADSSKKIEQLIKQMINQTQNTVSLIETTHQTIKKQDDIVNETDESFALISNTIVDNSTIIDGIVELINDMMMKKDAILQSTLEITAITQETAAETEEVSASVEEQSASMEHLQELANKVGQQADKLLEDFKNIKG